MAKAAIAVIGGTGKLGSGLALRWARAGHAVLIGSRDAARAAEAAAAAGTRITAVNPAQGPVSIEGYYDEAFSLPGLLEEIAKGEAEGVLQAYDKAIAEATSRLAEPT